MIEEIFLEDDPEKVEEIIEGMCNGYFDFCNPFYSSIVTNNYGQKPNSFRSGHFLWLETEGRRWMIYCEADNDVRSWAGQNGFQNWISLFKPQDCNDWLLAPRLYGHIVSMGEPEPDWDGIRARQGDSEKRVLGMSRGILAWEFQYRFLLYLADSSLERSEIDTLIRGYRRGKSTANDQLEELKLGKRSLRAIFDDHRQYFLGTPDYWSSGMLSRWYCSDI